MDFLKDILKEKGGDLIAELMGKAGLSAEQAETFLPEAGSSVGEAMVSRAADLDLEDIGSAGNIGTIMQAVDIRGLASKVGLSTEQGSQGLTALLPMLLGFIGQKGGGAASLLSMLGGGGALGGGLDALKRISGNFFK